MNRLDQLINDINENQNDSDIHEFKSIFPTSKFYFYLINDGSFASVDEIVSTSKERPIAIPIINEGIHSYGVLYAVKETAIANKEKRFRLSSIKGLEAIELMYGTNKITEIVVQGSKAKIYLRPKDLIDIVNIFEKR